MSQESSGNFIVDLSLTSLNILNTGENIERDGRLLAVCWQFVTGKEVTLPGNRQAGPAMSTAKAERKVPTGFGSSQQLQLLDSSQLGLGYSEFFP
jgi:hypothetical protein